MKSRKIVIADQHPLFREGFRKILMNSGNALVIGEACNSEELWELLRSDDLDVLFLDIRLPGENTVELTGRLHTSFPHLEIYAMSSFDNYRYVSQMQSAGAAGYLSKNLNNQEVITRIVRKRARTFIGPETALGTLLNIHDSNNK